MLAALERLGDLRQRGILTDEEFAAKKTEFLSRLLACRKVEGPGLSGAGG